MKRNVSTLYLIRSYLIYKTFSREVKLVLINYPYCNYDIYDLISVCPHLVRTESYYFPTWALLCGVTLAPIALPPSC